jgi:hypothetical protein
MSVVITNGVDSHASSIVTLYVVVVDGEGVILDVLPEFVALVDHVKL